MSYSDSQNDNARLLKRAVFLTAQFAGRSRRSEIIYYWIAVTIIVVVLDFMIGAVVSFETSFVVSNLLQIAFYIPMFALFVRRLHDQNRSGWWGLLLPLSFAWNFPQMLRIAMSEQVHSKIQLAASLTALAILIFAFVPGKVGANRYGPDPRLTED